MLTYFSAIFLGLMMCHSFASASQAILHDAVARLPKAELHLHLGGSYPLEYLKSIATDEQYRKLQNGIALFTTGLDYSSCFFIFELVNQIVTTDQAVYNGVKALCQTLKNDGVSFVEIRTTLKDLGSGELGYLQAILNGIQESKDDTFNASIALSVKRSSTADFVRKVVDIGMSYKGQGITSIEISGNSLEGDIRPLLPELQRAKKLGFPIIAHVGESPEETDQMIILRDLTPCRIGHGVHLCKEAQKWIEEHKIPVEVCLTSAVAAGMISSVVQHPGFELYKKGHPVVLCTDDPLVFNISLTDEYLAFAKITGCSMSDLVKLANQGIKLSL